VASVLVKKYSGATAAPRRVGSQLLTLASFGALAPLLLVAGAPLPAWGGAYILAAGVRLAIESRWSQLASECQRS
jgi:hypothetical protein